PLWPHLPAADAAHAAGAQDEVYLAPRADPVMTFQLHVLKLKGDTPGVSVELPFYRIGPPDAPEKVYLQAALHADEQPGTMLLHHLLPMLRQADEQELLRARFTVIPMANPLGMANLVQRRHLGRNDINTGVNYNRQW